MIYLTPARPDTPRRVWLYNAIRDEIATLRAYEASIQRKPASYAEDIEREHQRLADLHENIRQLSAAYAADDVGGLKWGYPGDHAVWPSVPAELAHLVSTRALVWDSVARVTFVAAGREHGTIDEAVRAIRKCLDEYEATKLRGWDSPDDLGYVRAAVEGREGLDDGSVEIYQLTEDQPHMLAGWYVRSPYRIYGSNGEAAR